MAHGVLVEIRPRLLSEARVLLVHTYSELTAPCRSVDTTQTIRNYTRKPPVEAALVVTYLQFPIQVCFPCIGQPVTDTASVTVTDTLRVLITVTIC